MNDASGQIPSVVHRNRCELHCNFTLPLAFEKTRRDYDGSVKFRRVVASHFQSRYQLWENCLKRAVTETNR